MERFTVEHLRVSNGTVAAYCTDRRASGDDSVYSIRLWVNVRNVLPVDNAATNGLDPKLAHVIIPMLGTVVCMDLFVLQAEEAPELLILCILCASADEISRFEVQYSFTEKRVIHVDTQEQSVPAVVKTLFNIDGTRAITASMLSGRRNNGNCSIITVWSEMLRRMRVLQPADDWRESTNVGTQLGTIVDIGFGGEDHVQLVFACYTSGIIMVMHIVRSMDIYLLAIHLLILHCNIGIGVGCKHWRHCVYHQQHHINHQRFDTVPHLLLLHGYKFVRRVPRW